MKKKRKGKKPKPSDNSAAAEDFLQEPVDAVQCLAWCGFFLFVDSVILDDWRAVLPRAVLQLQECPGMFQNDLETPTYEPEVWRSTTQGLGPLYTRRSTMAVVSTETRKTAATASSLREKSRSLAINS